MTQMYFNDYIWSTTNTASITNNPLVPFIDLNGILYTGDFGNDYWRSSIGTYCSPDFHNLLSNANKIRMYFRFKSRDNNFQSFNLPAIGSASVRHLAISYTNSKLNICLWSDNDVRYEEPLVQITTSNYNHWFSGYFEYNHTNSTFYGQITDENTNTSYTAQILGHQIDKSEDTLQCARYCIDSSSYTNAMYWDLKNLKLVIDDIEIWKPISDTPQVDSRGLVRNSYSTEYLGGGTLSSDGIFTQGNTDETCSCITTNNLLPDLWSDNSAFKYNYGVEFSFTYPSKSITGNVRLFAISAAPTKGGASDRITIEPSTGRILFQFNYTNTNAYLYNYNWGIVGRKYIFKYFREMRNNKYGINLRLIDTVTNQLVPTDSTGEYTHYYDSTTDPVNPPETISSVNSNAKQRIYIGNGSGDAPYTGNGISFDLKDLKITDNSGNLIWTPNISLAIIKPKIIPNINKIYLGSNLINKVM